MTKKELENATGQELIDQRNYCGVDGYYGDYLDDVNAEMLKRFNRLAELETRIEKMKSALIDIKSNTDDVNIEWQIKYLFDELEIKEND